VSKRNRAESFVIYVRTEQSKAGENAISPFPFSSSTFSLIEEERCAGSREGWTKKSVTRQKEALDLAAEKGKERDEIARDEVSSPLLSRATKGCRVEDRVLTHSLFLSVTRVFCVRGWTRATVVVVVVVVLSEASLLWSSSL